MLSRTIALFLPLAFAARPFLDYPDTAAEAQYGVIKPQTALPNVSEVVGLPDFQYIAEGHMNLSAFTYYRTGAAGEWSYRNNLEIYQRLRFRPRVMTMVDNIEDSLPTTILGHNFSLPIFISPCARAGYAHPSAETGLMRGANAGNVLYMVTGLPTLPEEEIWASASPNQTAFQQLYITPSNNSRTLQQIRTAERLGAKGLVLTVDSAADGNRHRAARFGVGSADTAYTSITWDKYNWMRNQTDLPLIPKGIMTVEDAIECAEQKVPAFIISQHGGRQLDTVPSSLEIAYEIYKEAPWVFEMTEVLADGGVRYGADVLKLLALGVKAVGLGRPFMFANVYGEDGVARAVEIMRREIAIDAANAGIGDLKKIGVESFDWKSFPFWGLGS